jgi:IS5 family transposase
LIIGHLKTDGHLGRCYLKGRLGDAANVILSPVGHNFRRILAWLRALWCLILTTLIAAASDRSQLKSVFLTDDFIRSMPPFSYVSMILRSRRGRSCSINHSAMTFHLNRTSLGRAVSWTWALPFG